MTSVMPLRLGTAFINGYTLTEASVTATVTPLPVHGPRPDPGWQVIDGSGHFHAFDADGKLPTLERRTAPEHSDDDDCSCEYDYCPTRSWYACQICGDEVKPRTLPDSEFLRPTLPGAVVYTVNAVGPAKLYDFVGQRVSFCCPDRFGVGRMDLPVSMEISSERPVAVVRVELSWFHTTASAAGRASKLAEPKPNDLARAIAAAASALHPAEFAHLAADRAVRAALAHLGLDENGQPK
jgi:hypothetical protein